MTQLFQVPATIQGINSLRDKTIKITIYTAKEIAPDEMTKLFALNLCEGWFLFSPNPLQAKDIPEEKAEIGINRKSLTERLYNVLYVYYEQNYSGGQKNFKDWRESEMEKIIQDYKNKLN